MNINERWIVKSNYKGNKLEVYTVETSTGKLVYDIMVNDGYWGTAWDFAQTEKYLQMLRDKIDKGGELYE